MARLNRRVFLRGLGGAVVAAPHLSSLAERESKARGVAAVEPRRLIVMFTHHGCLTDQWFPLKSHGPLGAEDYAGTSLEVLGPHAAKLLVPRGIRAMNEWTASQTTGQGNDPHLQVAGSYFTCVPVSPHGEDPFSLERATRADAMPTAPSLDHVCARQLNENQLPLVLRVSGVKEIPTSAISYSAGEQIFQGFGTAAEAMSALTGLFHDGPVSPDTYRVLRGKSVIDVVRADLEAFERLDMSRADREKLERWKELLSSTTNAARSASCNTETAAVLGLTAANLENADGDLDLAVTDPLTFEIAPGLDRADLFSNIAVLATLCDQSRIIVLKYPFSVVLRGLGIDSDLQLVAHRYSGPLAACIAEVNERIQTVDRFYAQKFAHLIATLDSFAEGDGTVLDNCAAVWFQELSDGNAHNLNNMPIIQAGGCGGHFRTGEAVNVDDGAADLSRGNSSIACDDQPDPDGLSTGTPAEFGNAPINKYYCNLMNALGVKAGADGFPLVGGTEPVTHYGMYDDTTDFASGGANPPRINDPGEFEALRRA